MNLIPGYALCTFSLLQVFLVSFLRPKEIQ